MPAQTFPIIASNMHYGNQISRGKNFESENQTFLFSDFMMQQYSDGTFQYDDGVKHKDTSWLTGQNMEQRVAHYKQNKEQFWSTYADWAIMHPVVISGWVDEFIQTSNAEIFELFPIQISKEAKFYKTEIIFSPQLDGPSVRKVPGRMIHYTTEQRSGNAIYTGQGFEIDYNRFKLPGGMEEFDIKISAVNSDIWLMVIFSALMEFQATPSIYNDPRLQYPHEDVPTTVERLFEYERTQFGALNKQPQAINNVISRVSEMMEASKSGRAGRIIMTKDCYYHVMNRDETNLYYDKSGYKAITNRADISGGQTVHGIRPLFVQMLEPQLHSDYHDSVLRHVVANGGMTVFPARYLDSDSSQYKSHHRKIQFSSWTADKLEEHCFMNFLHHCFEFIPVNSTSCKDGDQGNINYRLLNSLARSALGINPQQSLNPYHQTRTQQIGNEQKLHQFLGYYENAEQGGFYCPVRKIGDIDECHLKFRYLKYTIDTMESQIIKNLSEAERRLVSQTDMFINYADRDELKKDVEDNDNRDLVRALEKMFMRLSEICKDNVLGLSFLAAKDGSKVAAYLDTIYKVITMSTHMKINKDTLEDYVTMIKASGEAGGTSEIGSASEDESEGKKTEVKPKKEEEEEEEEEIHFPYAYKQLNDENVLNLFALNTAHIFSTLVKSKEDRDALFDFLSDDPHLGNINFMNAIDKGKDNIDAALDEVGLSYDELEGNQFAMEILHVFINPNAQKLASKIRAASHQPFIRKVATLAVLLQNVTLNGLQSWHENDVALPFSGRCFRPFETQFMESAIITADGPIGNTYFSGIDNTVAFDQGLQHFTMQFFTYFKVWIDNRAKFCMAPYIRGLQIIGGKGNKYINDHPNMGALIEWGTEAWNDEIGEAFTDMYKSVGEKLGDFSIIPVMQSLNDAVENDFKVRHIDLRAFWDQNSFVSRLHDAPQSFTSMNFHPMYDNQFLINHVFPQFTTQSIETLQRNSANFDEVSARRRVNFAVHQTTELYVNETTKDWEEVESSHYWEREGNGIVGIQTSVSAITAGY